MAAVAGIGVDLVEVARLRRLLDGPGGDGLRERLFTPAERAEAGGQADPAPHLAVCFAAKEAYGKALGCGISPPVSWLEIGVVQDAAGRPALALTGETARHFAASGGGRLLVSLSHGGDYALALVVLER